jgi:ATP-dependent DNA helicase RecQ
MLLENKVSADFYHAGLTPEQRSHKQDAWIAGHTRIMVCTNAFGMGIDKPDVRSVVHLDLPDSLEAYFQEAGRAGRDGKKSYAVLLYAPEDKASLEGSLKLAFPPLKEIRRVYQALGSYFQVAVGGGEGQSFDFDIADFCKNFKLEPLPTFSCLRILEQEGWLVLSEAIHLPSAFTVLVTREQLYDFQLKNPGLDLVAKTLIRVSEGAFHHYAPIHENAIARFLKMPADAFLAAVQQLHREGVIDYRPAREKPQLIFLRERVEAANLDIDTKQYNFRRERMAERIEKAIAYATLPECRSVQLLQYFGEKGKPCGICDVCLGRTESGLSAEDFERYKLKISQLLKKEQLTDKQLLDSFAANRGPAVLKALHFMLDEGMVNRRDGKLSLTADSNKSSG